jgi:hypothetical protein
MLKWQAGDLQITFEYTGDFDGWLSVCCPQCPKPNKLLLSRVVPNEPLFCTCRSRSLDAEEFRRTIREDIIQMAQEIFKGVLE